MKLFRKHKPMLIFSVYQHINYPEDAKNTDFVADLLTCRDIPYKMVLGRFNGQLEESFVVSAEFSWLVYPLAAEFNQSSVLYLDEYRYAHLEESTTPKYGVSTPIGHFVPTRFVPKGDYTYDPHTGTYYEVVK